MPPRSQYHPTQILGCYQDARGREVAEERPLRERGPTTDLGGRGAGEHGLCRHRRRAAHRRGYDEDEARYLTQSFFVHLLDKNRIALASPERGRFRTFLLTAMKNFLAGEWRKGQAIKRGGDVETVSMDLKDAEGRYLQEPAGGLAPDQIYERRWALGILERAVEDLRDAYTESGRGDLFEALKGSIGHADGLLPYPELSERLGLGEGALRSAVFRLRSRWRERIRELVAETVGDEADVDDELSRLLSSLSPST